VGVLCAVKTEQNGFLQIDKQLLQDFAARTAIAIQTAFLVDDAQRRIRDLSLLSEVGWILSSRLDVRDLMQSIVFQITDKLKCTHCTLFMPVEEEVSFFSCRGPPMACSQGRLRVGVSERMPDS